MSLQPGTVKRSPDPAVGSPALLLVVRSQGFAGRSEPHADGDHWRTARVDRLDDLRVARADAQRELSTSLAHDDAIVPHVTGTRGIAGNDSRSRLCVEQ
jgi:hypothetical protein